jgi:hypothetical protein
MQQDSLPGLYVLHLEESLQAMETDKLIALFVHPAFAE